MKLYGIDETVVYRYIKKQSKVVLDILF